MVKVCSVKSQMAFPKNRYMQKQNNAINATPYEVKQQFAPAEYYKNVLGISFKSHSNAQNIKPGCNYNERTKDLEFGIISKNATKINLYLFDKPVDGDVIQEIEMEKKGDKWVGVLDKEAQKDIDLSVEQEDPVYYGYRAWGENWQYDREWAPGSDKGFNSHVDWQGNRFNPNKLLFDPYSREISHDPVSPRVQGELIDDSLYTTGDDNYTEDTAAFSPKSIFIHTKKSTDTGFKPKRAVKDDIIYEVHLKGLTKLDEKIPERYRGTYKGAGLKAKYLKELGITMVEFLPVQEFQNDANDALPNKQNYWGYDPINWFSPDRRYSYDQSPGGPTKEFKEMVKAFHDEDIKVCMDVVYNHTGEAIRGENTQKSAIYSLKGLDNQTYYEVQDNAEYYYDNTGCGKNVNIANPITRDLVIDSINYWAEEMGVDAFRHDLATVLGNRVERHGFVFEAIDDNYYIQKVKEEVDIRSEDGKHGSVDMIAEPWAIGDGAYQLGNFPQFWMEWNDTYRDKMRKVFNKQESTNMASYASAVAGSSDHFHDENSKTRSINFITCHDGFTLKDLFSYNNKNNMQEGFTSDGGSGNNTSWDNFNDPIRQQTAMRNALLTLMMSKGTPLMLGGDEIIRTLDGNNNAYNQDKPKNYLNWSLNEDQETMQEFTKRIIQFRNSHNAIRNNKFFEGIDHNGNAKKDIQWLKPDATEAYGDYLDNAYNRFIGAKIDGTEFNDSSSAIYMVFNKGDENISFELPQNTEGKEWFLSGDTHERGELFNYFTKEGEEIPIKQTPKTLKPRSMMVFIEK